MRLPTLPRDVLAIIVDSAPFTKHQLCLISLASPHLRYEAQRKLFRNPGQHWIDMGSYPYTDSSLLTDSSFLHAVISSPDRLALMVRQYHVALSWPPPGRGMSARIPKIMLDAYRSDQESVLNHLLQAIPLMANLKELEFYMGKECLTRSVLSRPPPSITSILKRCQFRLEVFGCSYINVGHEDRQLMQTFLRSQEGIRELWICEFSASGGNKAVDDPDEFQNLCPSVVSVDGAPVMIVGMLLAGRRLQHICWKGSSFEQGDALLHTAEFSSVEFMESFTGGPSLDLICTAFRNLVLLKLAHTDILRTLGILSNLPRLTVLVFVFEDRLLPWFNSFMRGEERLIRRIFSSSLSLQCIEVHSPEASRRYIISRVTPIITVYETPPGIPLDIGERKEALLQRALVRVGPNNVLLKTFPT